MAKYRHVYSSFWSDMDVVARFTPEDKFFMLYILTNPHTTQIGVYKIPKKVIAYEMGYSIESINALIDRFQSKYDIIKYNEDTMEIAIRNWGRYNLIKGGTPVECCVSKELKLVKDITLIKYVSDEVANPTLKKMFLDYLKNSVDDMYYDTYHDTSEELKNDAVESEDFSDFYEELEDEELEENNEEYRKQANSNDTYYVSGGEKIKNKKIKEKYKKENQAQEEPSSDETSEILSQSDKTPYEEILLAFRSTCKSLPKVMARTKRRDKAMKALYKDLGSLEKIQELFELVENSDFLTGRDGKWSNCNFDWVMKQGNYIKVLEGTYSKNLATKSAKEVEAPTMRYGTQLSPPKDFKMIFGEM